MQINRISFTEQTKILVTVLYIRFHNNRDSKTIPKLLTVPSTADTTHEGERELKLVGYIIPRFVRGELVATPKQTLPSNLFHYFTAVHWAAVVFKV